MPGKMGGGMFLSVLISLSLLFLILPSISSCTILRPEVETSWSYRQNITIPTHLILKVKPTHFIVQG